MKFTIDSTNFEVVASMLKAVLPATTTLPIVQSVLVDAGAGNVSFYATDLVVGTKIDVPVEVIEEGKAVIEGKKLTEMVSTFKGDITFESKDSKVVATAKKPKRVATMATQPHEDFPVFPRQDEADVACHVDGSDLYTKVTTVKKFVAEPERILGGINVVMNNGLQLVSTDGNWMSIYKLDAEVSDEERTDITVLAEPLFKACKALSDSEDVELSISGNRLFVNGHVDDIISVVSSMVSIEGDYPRIEEILENRMKTDVLGKAEVDFNGLADGISPAKEIDRTFMSLGFIADGLAISINDSNDSYEAEILGATLVAGDTQLFNKELILTMAKNVKGVAELRTYQDLLVVDDDGNLQALMAMHEG